MVRVWCRQTGYSHKAVLNEVLLLKMPCAIFAECCMLCTGEMKRPQPRGLGMHAGDITEDVELIEGLEETKRIATDIEARSALAKETQVSH